MKYMSRERDQVKRIKSIIVAESDEIIEEMENWTLEVTKHSHLFLYIYSKRKKN